jgi:hypothetical protein
MNMCYGNDENSRLARRRGAIQAVLDAKRRHGGNEKVQKHGRGALGNVFSGSAEN